MRSISYPWVNSYLEAKLSKYFSEGKLREKEVAIPLLKLCAPNVKRLNLPRFYIPPNTK